MATAVRSTPPTPPPPPSKIHLTLSDDEANVLRFVASRIGGLTSGPRGQMDNIANALDSIGAGADGDYDTKDFADNIYFV